MVAKFERLARITDAQQQPQHGVQHNACRGVPTVQQALREERNQPHRGGKAEKPRHRPTEGVQGRLAAADIIALVRTRTDTLRTDLGAYARVVAVVEIVIGEVHAEVCGTHAQQHGQCQPPHEAVLPYTKDNRRQAGQRRLRKRDIAAVLQPETQSIHCSINSPLPPQRGNGNELRIKN